MTILQINKYYYLKGGADAVFFNTIDLLRSHGHKVIPFCINDSRNMTTEWDSYFTDAQEIREMRGVLQKIGSIPRFFINKDSASKIEQLIINEKPDVAHIHNIFNGISLSILPILKKYNIPIVFSIHDTRFICPSSSFNLRGKTCDNCMNSFYTSCFTNKCYQNSLINSFMCSLEMIHKEWFNYNRFISTYIFLNQHYIDMHAKRHSWFAQKGIVLPNFFPNLKTTPINTRKGDYLLYYGRITEEKGIRRLIDVMKDFPDVKLYVAGTGPICKELENRATDNITFLGFISGDLLIETIRNASFVIVPSECEENNPLTIIESYSFGKPVIGSRIGGIPELIEENKTGFIFNSFDSESLKNAINKAISLSDDEYEDFSLSAREFANKHFDSDNYYQCLMNIYNKAIN